MRSLRPGLISESHAESHGPNFGSYVRLPVPLPPEHPGPDSPPPPSPEAAAAAVASATLATPAAAAAGAAVLVSWTTSRRFDGGGRLVEVHLPALYIPAGGGGWDNISEE